MVSDVAQHLARLSDREFFTGPEDLVFANELGGFQDASSIRIRYGAALDRAGLRHIRFHDLRHTFGTLAVRRAEVPAVQAWMGHSDIQTTMRYVHHRDHGDEARLLEQAFRPISSGDAAIGTSRDVSAKRPNASPSEFA